MTSRSPLSANRPYGLRHASDRPLSSSEKAADIEFLIDDNISRLVPLEKKKGTLPPLSHHNVLLTGSTGTLGSHLVSGLLKDDRVHRVYSLNRSGPSSVNQRQSATFKDYALDAKLLSSDKLFSLEGDLTDEHFGLPYSVFDELLTSVTLIIHNAWQIDLKKSVAMFEPSIKGALNLINFARRSPLPSLRFLFISSVMSMQNLGIDAVAPECEVFDAQACLGTGYGEAKYVVERLLASSNIDACALRITQLYGGPPKWIYPVTMWLPFLTTSGVTLQQLPYLKGSASWLSMDCATKATLDIAFYRGTLPSAVNVCNPTPIPGIAMFTAIRDALYKRSHGSISLPIVPLKPWLITAQVRSKSGMPINKLPALKVSKFLQNVADAEECMNDSHELGGVPTFDTTIAQQISPALRHAEPPSAEVVSHWVDYWIEQRLLVDLVPPQARL